MNINDIKNVNFPFTLYDVFGYLIPGLTFCVLILLSEDLIRAIDYIIPTVFLEKVVKPPNFVFNEILIIFRKSPLFIFPFILLISYILGHLIAAISSLILERFIVEKFLNYPTQNLFYPKIDTKIKLFPKYRRAYSRNFIDEFKTAFSSKFSIGFSDPNDVFWISFEYVSYNCPHTFSRAMHFLNLYGYSRNLAMTFILSAIVMSIISYGYDLAINLWLLISFLLIALSLFWNYLKFLRRLNDEVFRGFYTHIKSWPNQAPKRTGKRVA